jgi:hypothetical protein
MAHKAAMHTDIAAVEHLFSWKARRLQIVVRMAEVELNADTSPVFPGGAWHVEGMEHERIVASGIYYLEHDNLTPCAIEFRHAYDEPPGLYYDEFACEQFWGARTFQEFGFVRKMGEVPIRAGRAVAFPNLWQHRVTSFKLQAGQTHGRRRVLVFFLVDPFRPVISSATVVPQERAWAHAVFFQQLRAAMLSCCDDLIGLIWSYIEDDFGWDAATATNFETKMDDAPRMKIIALHQHSCGLCVKTVLAILFARWACPGRRGALGGHWTNTQRVNPALAGADGSCLSYPSCPTSNSDKLHQFFVFAYNLIEV